jgi:polysaccharide pyruvyl transferase CsaB
MHVLVLSSFPARGEKRSPFRDAVSTYTYDLIQAMQGTSEDPLDITVLTGKAKDGEALPASLEERAHTSVRVERYAGRGVAAYPSILRHIWASGASVCHVQHEMFLYGGWVSILFFPLFLLAVRCRMPVVVTLHHVLGREQMNASFGAMFRVRIPSWILRFAVGMFYRFASLGATRFIVHADGFRDTLAEQYGIPLRKIVVAPHGVEDPTRGVTAAPSELLKMFGVPEGMKTVFGYFGFLAPYKNLSYLIDEFEKYARTDPSSVLLIAGGAPVRSLGDPAEQERIRAWEREARAASSGRILWLGPLQSEQVGPFFKLIDCLILPYTVSFSASGPLSLAMGSGVPTLASEPLRAHVEGVEVFFSFAPGSLEEQLRRFTRENIAEQSREQRAIVRVQNTKLWSDAARITLDLYHALRSGGSPTFLLLGAYGQGNLGDEVLLSRCLALLPRSECLVASFQPLRTFREHGVTAVDSQRHAFRKLWAVLRARVIIVGGGDQLKLLKPSFGRPSISLLAQYALLAVLCRLLGKKLLFLGIGVGKLSTHVSAWLSSLILRLATVVTFRDAESDRRARELAPGARLHLAADLAFAAPPPEQAAAPRRKDGLRLGIAPTFHLDVPGAYPHVAAELRKAVDAAVNEQPETAAIFLPFQTDFGAHDDIRVSEDILKGIEHPRHCMIERDLRAENAEKIFGSLDVLWGMRLHSLVFACRMGIPFIALVYEGKVQNFLREIGCERWGIPVDASFSASKLLALHRALLRERTEVSARLRSQAAALAERARVSETLLRGLLFPQPRPHPSSSPSPLLP